MGQTEFHMITRWGDFVSWRFQSNDCLQQVGMTETSPCFNQCSHQQHHIGLAWPRQAVHSERIEHCDVYDMVTDNENPGSISLSQLAK